MINNQILLECLAFVDWFIQQISIEFLLVLDMIVDTEARSQADKIPACMEPRARGKRNEQEVAVTEWF